jgi:hypothetical protein
MSASGSSTEALGPSIFRPQFSAKADYPPRSHAARNAASGPVEAIGHAAGRAVRRSPRRRAPRVFYFPQARSFQLAEPSLRCLNLVSPARSSAAACPASSSRAAVCSRGGDRDGRRDNTTVGRAEGSAHRSRRRIERGLNRHRAFSLVSGSIISRVASSPGIPSSELVVANALRNTFPEFLMTSSENDSLTKFVADRQTKENMRIFRLVS